MEDRWGRTEGPIPASYWVTAALGSLVVFVSYATAGWVPWFVRDMGQLVAPELYRFAGGVLLTFAAAVGLAFAGLPWLALRWPGLSTGLALLPVIPSLLDPQGLPLHFGVFASLCTVVLSGSWRSVRGAAVAAVAAEAFVLGWLVSGARLAAPGRAVVSTDYHSGGRTIGLALVYTLVVALVAVAAWRLRVSGLRELERRTLVARSGEVEQQAAVVGERARLARDLHDVVAHHVSLIAVRAETAPYTHPGLGDDARGVLTDIAADARLALDELRGVLGILGRSGEAERSPQPTWSDIPALVERTRSAGSDIEVVGDTTADVGPAAGYAAYRVVQEALTNARKHAPGARATLDLEVTSQLLTVLVSTPLATEAPASSTGGRGLVGMRERVEALGGRLLAGPVGEDFVVEAILPRGLVEGVA